MFGLVKKICLPDRMSGKNLNTFANTVYTHMYRPVRSCIGCRPLDKAAYKAIEATQPTLQTLRQTGWQVISSYRKLRKDVLLDLTSNGSIDRSTDLSFLLVSATSIILIWQTQQYSFLCVNSHSSASYNIPHQDNLSFFMNLSDFLINLWLTCLPSDSHAAHEKQNVTIKSGIE